MNPYLTVGLLALLAIIAACVWLVMRKRATIVNMANAANAPNQGIHADGRVTLLAGAAADFSTFAATYAVANPQAVKYMVVKVGADAAHFLVSAGATDEVIGVTTDAADNDDDPVNVAVFGAVKGTVRVVAAAVIAQWEYVQSNGDGAVKTAVATGFVIGRAVQAAGALGDIIEIVPMVNELAKA